VTLVVLVQTNEWTTGTTEYYRWTLVLVFEQLFVRSDFLASFIMMLALELEFAKQVSGHPIDFIELTLVPAEWTRVRILREPSCFAIAT